MLKALKLKNLALIEIIEINFEKGLNVFTGESGSGKSLILDSLNTLFGGTNIPLNHLIRPEKDECLIQATFDCNRDVKNWLMINGFKTNYKDIEVLRRSFKKNGKIITKYSINQESINRKSIESLGLLLLDFAGQSDTVLFNSQDHIKSILDHLSSDELKEINLKIKNIWNEYVLLKKEIELKTEKFNNEKENYFAKSRILNILEEANLTNGKEINDLKVKELQLANNFQLNSTIHSVLSNLSDYDDNSSSINLLINQSIKHLNKISKYDENITNFVNQLTSIQIDLNEITYSLDKHLQSIKNDDSTLEDVQKRIFYLQNLEKTFSLDLTQLIQKRDVLRKQILFENHEENLFKSNQILNNLFSKLNDLFLIQSSKRREVAKQLEISVSHTLKELGLANSVFFIDFKEGEPSLDGNQKISFLFSANPDQPLAPISQIISGGEMSRFIFALKFSINNIPDTLFLDEIDNGLSGKSLLSLVRLIKTISKQKQVLCITHHPLLAASANFHYKVEKKLYDGLTFTSLSKLKTKKEKQNELAELIGGGFDEATDYALTLLDKTAA